MRKGGLLVSNSNTLGSSNLKNNVQSADKNALKSDLQNLALLIISEFPMFGKPSEVRQEILSKWEFKTKAIRDLVTNIILTYPFGLPELKAIKSSMWTEFLDVLDDMPEYKVLLSFAIGLLYFFYGLLGVSCRYFRYVLKNHKHISNDVFIVLLRFFISTSALYIYVEDVSVLEHCEQFIKELSDKDSLSTSKSAILDAFSNPDVSLPNEKDPIAKAVLKFASKPEELMIIPMSLFSLLQVARHEDMKKNYFKLLDEINELISELDEEIKEATTMKDKSVNEDSVGEDSEQDHFDQILAFYRETTSKCGDVIKRRMKLDESGILNSDLEKLEGHELLELMNYLYDEAHCIYNALFLIGLEFLALYYVNSPGLLITPIKNSLGSSMVDIGNNNSKIFLLMGPLFIQDFPGDNVLSILTGIYYFYKGKLNVAEKYLKRAKTTTYIDVYRNLFLVRTYILRKKRTPQIMRKIEEALNTILNRTEYHEDIEFIIGAKLALNTKREKLLKDLRTVLKITGAKGIEFLSFYSALKNNDTETVLKLKRKFLKRFHELKPLF